MDSNIIQDAIESGDPSAASEAIREIDSRVQRLTSSEEKAGLLLNTAVLLGILGCFEEAREALVAALRQNPDDAQTRLRFDYIDGCLYHQEAKAAEAFTRFTAILSKCAGREGRVPALCQAGKTRLGSSRRKARSQSMFIPVDQWPTAFRYNEPSPSSPHAI